MNDKIIESKILELEQENEKLKHKIKKLNVAMICQKNIYENKISELQNKLAAKDIKHGGRKPKFTPEERESMKMYRLQGLTIEEIAEMFKCSVGLVYNVISELR